ncbi:CidB/LrgB family autolysis modulator [Vibrio breoganii]|uniref:CidB/LrgB family autolysis modulator n=1 Tax=Vibrio breoganii TaxID=553239 RepID=UPI000307E537|nr:CidB/LrgB family autolysis modulator [Vibrio breoganii]OED92317.1 CidB/LrgB family autolysis modulator [Vibrio breoganii ZF-55]OEF81773.1 CidB/LrgB family autolysis modulator [Vibrio breoganii 1C10]PMG87356.1 CidB/LrgB family autolysis modulator [Vibrio breoganii]PML05571.1 CidB/LrgB family autolysis modulator [Vibrio breoganii]PML94732.1 CidB/LrgB family autolysis modulator [Vibrio breoganii]
MWLLLSIVVYFIARFIAKKAHHPLANPLLISLAIIIPFLLLFKVPYQTYYQGNELIQHLLQPAVVALAYPLYEQLNEIRAKWKLILTTCVIGSLGAMLSSGLLAVLLGADSQLLASIMGKSVTTAIAMQVSAELGGEPAVAAILVLLAGLTGSLLAYPVYQLLKIKHPIAKGLTMGTVSHALGTATAFEHSQKDAAFSSLALVLCGVITSLLAPFVMTLMLSLSS